MVYKRELLLLTLLFCSGTAPSGAMQDLAAAKATLPSANIRAIAVDASGFVYAIGRTISEQFPSTPGVLQESYRKTTCGSDNLGNAIPCGDAFVAKLDLTQGRVVWATYLGGASDDDGYFIHVDDAGAIYIAGTTYSADFPVTANAPQPQNAGPVAPVFQGPIAPGGDLFIAKVSKDGDEIVYSTFFGGPAVDNVFTSEVDTAGAAYVAGATFGTVPTTPGAYDRSPEGQAGTPNFALKVNPAGTTFAYATYLPGLVADIAVDQTGGLSVAGVSSGDLPASSGAYQSQHAGRGDAFLLRLNPAGSGLEFATYVGGSESDEATSMAVDSAGNYWLSGITSSPDFAGVPGSVTGAHVNFLVKLNDSGSQVMYARVLETTGLSRFTNGPQDSLIWSGLTSVRNMPTTPDAPLSGGCGPLYNPYVVRMAADASMQFGSYLPYSGQVFVSARASDAYLFSDTSVSKVDLSADRAPGLYCIVHAATYSSQPGVAPGQIVSLFGSKLGPQTPAHLTLDPDGRVSKSLGGVTVTFDGIPAPLLYADMRQVNAVVPFGIAGRTTTTVEIRANGEIMTSELPVVGTNFGIFTKNGSVRGQGAIVNEDGTVNSTSNPARLGSVISIYGTGAGDMSPAQVDGEVTGSVPPKPKVPVRAFLTGGREIDVDWVGAAPSLVAGVIQINVRLPENVDTPARTAMPIWVELGGERPTYLGATVALE